MWIFKSNKNKEALISLFPYCYELKHNKFDYEMYRNGTDANILCSRILDLIAYKLSKYKHKMKQIIQVNVSFVNKMNEMYLINKNTSYHERLFDSSVYSSLKRQKETVEFRKHNMRCGNNKCKILYHVHKYGIRTDASYSVLKPINKWYRCAGCKLMYYCSRKCQKYAWNMLNHRMHCQPNQIHRLYNDVKKKK
eukprot:412405_1